MKLLTTAIVGAVLAASGCAYTFESGRPAGPQHREASCSDGDVLGSIDQFLAAGEVTAGVAVALSGMERNGIDGHRLAYGTFAIEAGVLHAASSAWSRKRCAHGPAEQVGMR